MVSIRESATMMYADLVDMSDFIAAIELVGVKCHSQDSECVKNAIEQWLTEVDIKQTGHLWEVILRLEREGILLPEVEKLIDWSYDRYH
jgi:hypothetical protein